MVSSPPRTGWALSPGAMGAGQGGRLMTSQHGPTRWAAMATCRCKRPFAGPPVEGRMPLHGGRMSEEDPKPAAPAPVSTQADRIKNEPLDRVLGRLSPDQQ